MEPRKNVAFEGADAVVLAEGCTEAPNGLAQRSLRGLRAGHASIGVSQEPGRSCRLHQKTGAGEPGEINPGPHLDRQPGCVERTRLTGGGIRS